jgi:protoporphyrinogen oxidase
VTVEPDIVLGGGVAGLSAACRLSRDSDRPVVVLEKNPWLGGLASTFEWEGCRLDLGPHRIYTVLPEIEKFILSILGSEVLRVRRQSSMRLSGRYLNYPVSFGEVFKALGPWVAARIPLSYLGARLTPWRYPEEQDQSYEDYISSRFGPYLYRLLFRDYAVKVWQDDPGDLSAQMAKIRLATPNLLASAKEVFRPTGQGVVTEFLYPKGGIGRLSEGMGRKIEAAGGRIETGFEVTGLDVIDHRVKTIRGLQNGREVQYQPGRVISTLPLPQLVHRLRPEPARPVLEAADGLPFASAILVYVLCDEPEIRPDCWLYFPEREIIFTRSYEMARFDRGNVPQGQSSLCLEIPCREGDSLWNLSDEEIVDRVFRDLENVQLGPAGKWKKSRVIRLRNVYPVYRTHYERDLEAVSSYLMQVQNLISTGRGGFFNYNNIDHSIDMGLLAAEFFLHQHTEGSDTSRFYRLRPRFEQYRIVD